MSIHSILPIGKLSTERLSNLSQATTTQIINSRSVLGINKVNSPRHLPPPSQAGTCQQAQPY